MKGIEKAKCITEIIKFIEDKFKDLKDENEIFNLWFRAENANVKTPLIPNAYRKHIDFANDKSIYKEVKTIEDDLKAMFNRQSVMYLNENRIADNEWNQYFLMQHYGLSTRLLDWTESALIAIYFAVKDYENKDDAKIWILAPHRLNLLTSKLIMDSNKGFDVIYFPQSSNKMNLFDEERRINLDELLRKYLTMDFNNSKDKNIEKFFPLAIYPYLFDERMKTQQSCFTIFGNEINGLLYSENSKEYLSFILIDGKNKKRIKEELRWLGISEQHIYPSLESNCKWIEEKFK